MEAKAQRAMIASGRSTVSVDEWEVAIMTSARRPQEIFGHHGSALAAEDIEDRLRLRYDVTMIAQTGTAGSLSAPPHCRSAR
ncbi:MAG: hypothetical protein ACM3ZF_16525 [Mycobacterium leprae]